jgi:sigma-B regulation protein RsbU (phosphoserine phosphatase)
MRANLPALVDFVRKQGSYLALSAIFVAIFWANGQQINPLTVLLYSLLIGNLTMPALESLHGFYAERPFPYSSLFFLSILLLLLFPVYVVSSVIVWWLAPPTPQTLVHLLKTGWKLPLLITFVFSVVAFLHQSRRRNVELQRSVELGHSQIEAQEQELQRALDIQQSLLPKEIPQLPGFEVAAVWRPASTVSGDYFDVVKLSGHRLGICIADVVGKGVSAALLMANVQAAVRAFASDVESAACLCGKVNRLLCENIATGKFVTFLYCVLDSEVSTIQYCNAGHPYPILVSNENSQMLEESGAVLGVFPEWTYEDTAIDLRPGDRLLLFTDGITEASGADEQEFGEAKIAAFALANRKLSARDLNGRLLADVSTFCDAHFRDDATLLVIAAN